ncbi:MULTISPECIES: hypothetical protein [Brevundimonas]|jgi:hypothetical protein|uniref:hypothetical protein n=1 Tax=Brevundimonas TaxID=41275 RepID=UPI002736165D|nr:hypothetical protein [Brevundimonas sp.]MDP3378730.1 hypothetical protein [Brevundimonas sp.]|tara:strand:- start:70 stop:519 length:450 start_codon:yes stop_codon:yes gene_type:complete
MTTDYKSELTSGDRARVLAALYQLSGDDRKLTLPPEVYEEVPALIESEDEEIAWRAIIAFGLVRPTPSLSIGLVEAAKRWLPIERFVGLAALDGIARLIGADCLSQMDRSRAVSEVSQIEGVDPHWLSQFSQMASGQISYEDFVGSVGD